MKERSKMAEEINSSNSSKTWTPDSASIICGGCSREFSLTRRKHHCRQCFLIFCSNCSEHVLPLENNEGTLGKPVRVCDGCWESITSNKN